MSEIEFFFLKVANEIEMLIKHGVLKVGDKLPSLRKIAKEKNVSKNTALNAYFELERRGLIESKAKSGYYVTRQYKSERDLPSSSNPIQLESNNDISDVFTSIYINNGLKGINLSSTQLSPELLPIPKLNKEIIASVRKLPYGGVQYERFGNQKLKNQIALRSLRWGGNLKPDDIMPTQGCFDAIMLCLMTLLKPGDVIGMESPLHFGLINLAKSFGYKILELPTNPATGLELEALKETLRQGKIDLLLLMGNYSNPFGSCMPDENKKEVVRLLTKYDIPMIEDDIYSDFHFDNKYPTFCKTYDESGLVMWCGSVSKTLAGGYRVGWLVPGKFEKMIRKAKPYHPVNCNSITHEAVASFFENNRYDNYLKKIRHTLYHNSLNFLHVINEYFPADTKVTSPQGGMQLWVELNHKIDTMQLYNVAIANKVNISPGRTYTLQNQYNNCFKLSYGMVWNAKIENALKSLGKLCSK
jgi:DNA-binding transcriptional MocR family regulator